MAKKHLEQYDKNGNKLDIYLNEDEVMVGDQTLADKLSDMEEDIDEAGQTGGSGTVTGVKVGSTTYEPTDGVVDLSTPFGGKVDKNGTDSLMTAAEHTKLQDLPTNEQLTQQLGGKANDAEVVKSISVNGGSAQKPTNGNVNIVVPSGGLTKSDISVETQGDGTVDINVGSDTYTVNLNHTHENMAKLIVCEESDLPSTLDGDTIYGVEEDGEISVLYVGGIPFYGGGGGVLPDEPILRRPADGSTVDFGKGDSLTKVITVKGINLAHDLTLELSGSGYSFGTTQPTGVTRTDGTHMTITAAAANTGVDIVVDYAETGLYASGTLSIEGSSDGIDTEVTLVANTDVVAYWDGGDAVQSSKWVDRVNSIPFTLYGTAGKVSDGYQLNCLSAQRAAYALIKETGGQRNYLNEFNTAIKKEFTCIVDFKAKMTATDKRCPIIDFGCYGDALSTLAIGCMISDERLIVNFKLNGQTSGFYDVENYANLDSAITLNSYNTLQLKVGAKILSNGKQELYAEIGTAKCYAIINNPVDVGFAGIGAINSPASLGFGYDTNAASDFPKGSFDIIYQGITIFNSAR